LSSITGNGVSRVIVTCVNAGSGGGGGSSNPTGNNGYWSVSGCVRGDTYTCTAVKAGTTIGVKTILAI
jgi:hypothetical protein